MTQAAPAALIASQQDLWVGAAPIKPLPRVRLPELVDWNYGPCDRHAEPKPDCEFQACGGDLFDHQTTTVTWLYAVRKGILASEPGTGKAGALDSLVYTPTGYRAMKEIAVGDEVLTPGGAVSTVLGVYPQPAQTIYRVTLSDGSSTRVTGEHLWQVRDYRSRRRPVEHVLTTDQLRQAGPRNAEGRLVFQLPDVRLDTPDLDLPIDPYALGLLIGNGSFRPSQVRYCAIDPETVDYLRQQFPDLAFNQFKQRSRAREYMISGRGWRNNTLLDLIRSLGLGNTHSVDKFIPPQYLLASYDQRLELLRGLMDSDGHIDSRHSMEFSTSSPQLAQDVLHLIRSLGGFAKSKARTTRYTLADGTKSEPFPSFRITLNCPANPFRIERKACLWREPHKTRRIISIEEDGWEPAQCIRIDHPDHLYLADDLIPTHNTNSMLATLCLAKQRGEQLRAVLVVPTTSVAQWAREARRFAPGLFTSSVSSGMTKAHRNSLYSNTGWELLIIGFHLMTRDVDALVHCGLRQLISDDVDPLLNPSNATHEALEMLSASAERVIVANATNLQTQLLQLWAAAVPIGGKTVWRTKTYFQDLYVQKNRVRITVGHETDPATGRRRAVTRNVLRTTGYKNLTHFRDKFLPMMIRHRYEDLSDIRIPDVIIENVYLDLHPAQRTKYEQLQAGVLELMRRDEPPQRKQVTAATAWNHGAQVCAGLPALGEPDGPEASSKLDWTVNAIQRWAPRKIVVYARNRGTIAALQQRLTDVGVGHETIWGVDPDKDHRQASQQRFWQDPQCRVMILSAAGERSLNLQNAQVLVQLDLNLNPARIHQLMGRVRRAGSPHERVFAFSLLAVNTQEDRYQASLATRQHLFDAVHGEDHSDMFERLDPEELMRLIRP